MLCLQILRFIFHQYYFRSSKLFSSVAQLCPTLEPHGLQHARPPCPSPTAGAYPNPHPLSQWCHPTILSSASPSSPPSVFPSIRVFSNESALHIGWPKYWSFSFSISPSSEQPGLISFRMDWLDLLAVQGTLKSLLQHHSSKASILQHSAYFIVQPSHPYMTTGKTTALIRWTFVDKVMCVCIYIYIYTHICLYIYVCTHMYIHIHMCTHIHAYVYVYMYVFVCVCICLGLLRWC